MNRCYLCIDLKTFYASVECAELGLDPFKTNLVVADTSRGKGTICLAVTPHMKSLGIRNRCRLFEIPANVKYQAIKPHMHKYMEYANKIYEIYLRYLSKDDIHPYSIDEMFLDITDYLKLYNKTPFEIANTLMNKIYEELHIVSTAGIGPNLYLAKVALDILAKHEPTNIGYLDEKLYIDKLSHHLPLTDFWGIGRGIEAHLNRLGIYDMADVRKANEDLLYNEFGVNAEILIDHAKGIEPVTIKNIKNYKPKANSISKSQILFRDYDYTEAFLVMKEMVELLALDLVKRKVATNSLSLYIGYSKNMAPATGGTIKIDSLTSSYDIILEEFIKLFKDRTLKNIPIRRIGVGANNLKEEVYAHGTLFTNPDKLRKEKNLMKTMNNLKERFGKNSILRGMNLEQAATTIERNKLIGGHNA